MNTPFEKKVCYTLCCCELTAVLSCVFIFYLTFGIYLPAYRQLNAGFSNDTVMCTTVSNKTLEICEDPPGVPSWASCGEWCLSKSSGGTCTQIRVNVRRHGTNIQLEGCDTKMEDVIYCDEDDPKQHLAECILGQCADLTGLYNCSSYPVSPGVTEAAIGARCRDLTRVLACNLTSTDPGIQCRTKTSCLSLEGLHLCRKGLCARIRPPFQCEKKCTGIVTAGKSIIVRENNIIFTARCQRAIEMETNEEIWPKNLKSGPAPRSDLTSDLDLDPEDSTSTSTTTTSSTSPTTPPTTVGSNPGSLPTEVIPLETDDPVNTTRSRKSSPSEPPILVIFCTTIVDRQTNSSIIKLMDCFNGTLMEPGIFGPVTDIRILTREHVYNTRMLDPSGQIAPIEDELIIQPNAPLYINYEGCVNTLILRECEKFHAEYGVDGDDFRTNKRFPCYYRPAVAEMNDTGVENFVILRYDIQRTTMELIIAAAIPSVLAVISCFLLVVFSKVIKIGDDQRFYLEGCGKIYKPKFEEVEVKKK